LSLLLRLLGVSAIALALAETSFAEPNPQANDPASIPYLGVLVAPVSWHQQIQHGMDSTDPGVQIVGIDPGSPADRARFRQNDLIVRANGNLIYIPADLDRELARLGPGDTIPLLLSRGQETREVDIPVATLPQGFVGFTVQPLSTLDTLRATLPSHLASNDELPVVSWIQRRFPWPRNSQLRPGSVIVSVNGTRVSSVEELHSLTEALRMGDDVSLVYFLDGQNREMSIVAQVPPKSWSGLHLEELTPFLTQAESLSMAEVEAGGLFVRRVEAASPGMTAGLKERDQILSLDGVPLTSLDEFHESYDGLPLGQKSQLVVRRTDGGLDTVSLTRDGKLGVPRKGTSAPSPYAIPLIGFGRGRGQLLLDLFAPRNPLQFSFRHVPIVVPFPSDWTKVTGVNFIGGTSLRLTGPARAAGSVESGRGSATLARARWEYGFGLGYDRWSHSLGVDWRSVSMSYIDKPTPFYHERISNQGETWFFAMLLGEDDRRYVDSRGWTFSWRILDRPWPGHSARFRLGFLDQEPLANASAGSLFGRNSFAANPEGKAIDGRSHSATFSYAYSKVNRRAWTRSLLMGEVRMAGALLGGDREFVRWEANAVKAIRLSRRVYASAQGWAGLATGSLPPQERFYAGGKGTLPGYADHEFSGDRAVVINTQLAWVLFGKPEQRVQFRLFSGVDTGNAWESDSGSPRFKNDLALGFGLFLSEDFQIPFPTGVSATWARPLDKDDGDWRFQLDFFGGAVYR
jgi:S1-C subfamily serine protease